MAIFDTGDTIRRWKYITKFIKVTLSNKRVIDIPVERLKKIEVEENYEEHYFPIIKITLVLDSTTYYDIIKDKNNCKINLRVDKFYFDDEKNTERSITKKFLNDTFELIMDESTDDMYNSVKENENSKDYTKKTKDI